MFSNRGQLGDTFSIFTFMITAFLVVVMFAGLIWVMGTLNDVFTEVGVINENTPHETYYFPCVDNASATCSMNTYTNMSLASEQIWGNAYTSIQALRMVAVVYILALAGSIIIVGFLQKKHPFLFFVYILIVLLAVLFAPTISNAYETLLQSGIFDDGLVEFTASNFILLNLSLVVLVIGALGGIGLFIQIVRVGDERNL
jgi:predicted membrane channel-forming protein YqfA (hemolysin III family)